MIRRAFVNLSKLAFNGFYRAWRKSARDEEVVFLSRQTDDPSYDFVELAREFESRGWKATMHLKKVSARRMPSYVKHVLRELRLLGRCKLAVLDRYDPVVSLLDFECERAPVSGKGVLNIEFPVRPVILQMWHAFGAYKNFGFQSTDTPEGHSESFMSTFKIHRNYSWVMCSGEGARDAYAQAFACPIERVIAFDRPEYDEIASLKAKRDKERLQQANTSVRDCFFKVLMAPTLRYSKESAHPFRDLYDDKSTFDDIEGAQVIWSFHPLESGLPAPGNVSDLLLDCDLVITDYSSIVYEAYLLGIPTLFYMPDLESYRKSPGLNADPSMLCPSLCIYQKADLIARITSLAAIKTEYDFDALEAFAGPAFDISHDREANSAAARIADFLISEAQKHDMF